MLFIKKRRNKYVRKLISSADKERDCGNLPAAATIYRAALECLGEDHGILIQLANSLKDNGNFSEAKTAYETAVKINPQDPDCYLQLGHLHKLMGNKDDALDYYQKSIDLKAENNPAIGEYEWLHNDIQRHQSESRHLKLRNKSAGEKINIFFGTPRESHAWNLGLSSLRFYKKLNVYNGWRR